MLKQFQRYFCISKYISIWSQHVFSFPAWPGSLESRGEVVGACFSMGSHLSILLYSPQRNLLFREGFPPTWQSGCPNEARFLSVWLYTGSRDQHRGRTACLQQGMAECPAGGPFALWTHENNTVCFRAAPWMCAHVRAHLCSRGCSPGPVWNLASRFEMLQSSVSQMQTEFPTPLPGQACLETLQFSSRSL